MKIMVTFWPQLSDKVMFKDDYTAKNAKKSHCDFLSHSLEKNIEFWAENRVTRWKSPLSTCVTYRLLPYRHYLCMNSCLCGMLMVTENFL